LEHKLRTHDWSQRVNTSLLGVCIVEACLLHSGARGAAALKQSEFYEGLAAALVDNSFDSVGWRPRRGAAAGEGEGGGAGAGEKALGLAYGVGVHLKPTTKRRLDQSSGATPHLRLRYCLACKAFRSTLVCSACRYPTAGAEMFFCGPKTGRSCFANNLRAAQDTFL